MTSMGLAGLAIMFLGTILLVAVIAFVVWALFRIFQGPQQRASGTSQQQGDPAEETLRGRFARGEIDAEEYEKTLEILRRERNTTKDGA